MPTATHTPRAVRGMTAVSKGSGVKPLGHICWFSVPDEPVSLRRVKRIWQMAGLDPAPLPKDPKEVNVFKRVVRELERSESGNYTDPQGFKVETDVRLLLENSDEVIYEVARVTRHPDTGIEYPKAIRVWYSKQDNSGRTWDFQPLGGLSRKDVMAIASEIEDALTAQATKITGAKVRTLVRNYIREESDEGESTVGLSGENLRGKAGGVYFVLARFTEQLESLAEFLDELYEPHGRAYLYTVPLADGKSEREMIRARQVANCMEDMRKELATVKGLLTGDRSQPGRRAVRSDVASYHWTQLQKMRRRAAAYKEALRGEQDELEAEIDVLSTYLDRLV